MYLIVTADSTSIQRKLPARLASEYAVEVVGLTQPCQLVCTTTNEMISNYATGKNKSSYSN